MNPTKVSESVLKKITLDHIKPKARWIFVVKTLGIVAGGILFFLLGIIGSTILWHFVLNLELLEIFTFGGKALLKAMIIGIPVLWIACALGGGFVATTVLRKMERGYKISLPIFFFLIVMTQIVIGFSISQSPGGQFFEEQMERQIFFYENVIRPQEKLWSRPEEGFLSGTITEIFDIEDAEETQIKIMDFQKKEWNLKIDITAPEQFRENMKIKVLGKKLTDDTFQVEKIIPFGMREKRMPPPHEKRMMRPRFRPEEGPENQERFHMMRPPIDGEFPPPDFIPDIE